ncbi:MAG: hypothetical protein AUK52_01485 [Comamonadaceae bacterium CG2_30_60_41]|nr:MAG: hypothetical protein AUK52_01485 [Comamonadaceae bacterium CG2_30_60_41]
MTFRNGTSIGHELCKDQYKNSGSHFMMRRSILWARGQQAIRWRLKGKNDNFTLEGFNACARAAPMKWRRAATIVAKVQARKKPSKSHPRLRYLWYGRMS